MKRKTYLMVLSLVLALLGGSAGLVILLMKYEPHFYRRSEVPAEKRKDLASEFRGQALTLGNYLRNPEDAGMEVVFTESQINSFLQEEFGDWPDSAEYQSRGISAPRVSIDKDRLRLAFRYTNSLVSTIVSLDLRIWVVSKQGNLFAVEILNRHVGAMPFSAQSLQDEIADLARNRKVEVTWYRYEGNPVALLRLQNSQNLAPAWINRIDMETGRLTIGVLPLEAPPANAKAKVKKPLTSSFFGN